MREIVLIVHNIRSCHNVGSILRTADGLGVSRVYLAGYTPYPLGDNDPRIPHLAQRAHKQIAKTALGAEKSIAWEHRDDTLGLIRELETDGYSPVALEQSSKSGDLTLYRPLQKSAIVIGNEVSGLEAGVLGACDTHLAIPMFGKKESFNVAQAAAMALYHFRFAKNAKSVL